jgi:glycolate oxidase subunit GlcD
MLKESARRSLMTLLPRGQVFLDPSALISYEIDGGIDKGLPEGVVFPRNTDEIVSIVRWSAEYKVPLVARGAGTGLSGGAVADRGGIIVDFAHMNRILNFDPQGRSVVAEPALINLRLDEQAKTAGFYFPPDPSSQRASTIGGNVAENSGGPHCFKYGVTTNYVTGLEVVLADGRKIRAGGRAFDYPEYDLCGLLTGSEGTLALITKIAVRLQRNPPGIKTMLAIFDTTEDASKAVSAIIAAGLVPATIEMMDQKIIGMIEPFAHAGLPLDAGAVLIIEVDGYPESLDTQIEEIAILLRARNVREMRFARNEEERYKIWLARKSVAGAITRLAPTYYTVDVTVPRSRLTEMLLEVDTICEQHQIRVGQLMHAGDGNLHPMLLIPNPEDQDLMRRIHAAGRDIVQRSVEMEGSLTGEHGVGIEKREFMSMMHTTAELMVMWDVKQTFDPYSLLNPGKLFPTPGAGESGPFAGYSLQYQHVSPSRDTLPGNRFVPESAEEAADGLLTLTRMGKQVFISNALTGIPENGVQLSTAGLCGIKRYAPDDMYITVGAGMMLAEVQQFLAQDRRQLALASPWPAATIGGLISANINAPLRMRYGSLRDQVLYTRVVLADGRIIRTGRPIVKNVAGYDLTKAFVGAHGTLGLLSEVSLKVVSAPRVKHTLLIPVDDLRHALTWTQQLLSLALVASSVLICKGYQPEGLPESKYLLVYSAEGLAEDVQAELKQIRQALHLIGSPDPQELEMLTGTDIWSGLLGEGIGKAVQIRIGLPAGELPAYLQDQLALLNEGAFIADIANGFIYVLRQPGVEIRSWLETLRHSALLREGYAVVLDMPEAVHGSLERWGYQPQGSALMRALKERWDPHCTLVAPDEFADTFL